MYIAKSRHLWNHILLLFFMLSKAFSMKVVDSCTTKSKQPITAGNIEWITDELGTRQFSVDLGGLVQAVGALRITKPDKTDIPNAWYVYWDTPMWVNGYFNDVFDPTVKDPPKWVGDDPYTYTNPYNVVNVPESQPLAVNMDLYTDCFTDQSTKELNCFRCNAVVKTQAPPSAVARQLSEGVDYPEPWLAGLFKSKKGQQ